MATLKSPFWDKEKCFKHFLKVPCSQCADEQDPDVQVAITMIDMDVAEAQDRPLADFIPSEFAWCNNYVGA